MPLGLGIWELVILLGILALLFGAKGVPQIARRLGGSVREVREAVGEVGPRRMLEAPAEPKPPPRSAAPPPPPQATAPRPPDDPQVSP
jgi:sec-independent protein translocase protein TatA